MEGGILPGRMQELRNALGRWIVFERRMNPDDWQSMHGYVDAQLEGELGFDEFFAAATGPGGATGTLVAYWECERGTITGETSAGSFGIEHEFGGSGPAYELLSTTVDDGGAARVTWRPDGEIVEFSDGRRLAAPRQPDGERPLVWIVDPAAGDPIVTFGRAEPPLTSRVWLGPATIEEPFLSMLTLLGADSFLGTPPPG